jgi:hypothetical protein
MTTLKQLDHILNSALCLINTSLITNNPRAKAAKLDDAEALLKLVKLATVSYKQLLAIKEPQANIDFLDLDEKSCLDAIKLMLVED